MKIFLKCHRKTKHVFNGRHRLKEFSIKDEQSKVNLASFI